MRTEDLKVNQLIYIEVQKHDLSKERLSSRIEGLNKESLIISMPMKSGTLFPLNEGQEIAILVVGKIGLFGAQTRVLARFKEPIPLLVVERPRQLIGWEQRREHVRLPIGLPVDFAPQFPEQEELQYYTGISRDISAGGILLISRVLLDPDQIINLRFYLDEEECIACQGQVIRSISDSLGSRKFASGIKFIDINNEQREKIYRFVFSKQREWLQKGLL